MKRYLLQLTNYCDHFSFDKKKQILPLYSSKRPNNSDSLVLFPVQSINYNLSYFQTNILCFTCIPPKDLKSCPLNSNIFHKILGFYVHLLIRTFFFFQVPYFQICDNYWTFNIDMNGVWNVRYRL